MNTETLKNILTLIGCLASIIAMPLLNEYAPLALAIIFAILMTRVGGICRHIEDKEH